MIDAALGFIYGIFISAMLIGFGFSQNGAIQTIINAEREQVERRFVVLCQANEQKRVRCVPQIEEQAP